MVLPQGCYKTFFRKNLLLMKITPILDQAVFSFPPNVGERFSIHSKILKTPFLICFQLRKRWWYSPYCPLNWLLSWTPTLSLFSFKWTISEAIRRWAVSSLVSSIIATGLLSAPIIGLHHTIPTCRQAAGRSAPTFGIGVATWICLHCKRALRVCVQCLRLLWYIHQLTSTR